MSINDFQIISAEATISPATHPLKASRIIPSSLESLDCPNNLVLQYRSIGSLDQVAYQG